jgi:hypothetical protein
MAVAPDDFGKFGGALLVGNFGDSRVSAFDPESGRFLGQLEDAQGNALVLNGGFKGPDDKGLWGIAFGKSRDGDGRPVLYFAAGIGDESHGVFGKVTRAEGEGEGEGDHHEGDNGDDHQGDQGGDNHQGDQGDDNGDGHHDDQGGGHPAGDNGPGSGSQDHGHAEDRHAHRAGRRHHGRHGREAVIRVAMTDRRGG